MPARTRRLRQWLLALLLLATLAPGLSRLQRAAQQRIAPWAELCASAAQPSADARTGGRGDAAAHLLDVCAACVGGLAWAGPPALEAPAAVSPVEALPLSETLRNAYIGRWVHAPPRGPPVIA